MTKRDHSGKIASLLLPAMLAFAFQSSLEVIHPIEEQTSPGHDHGNGGVFLDPGACDADGHGPHFCAHTGADARIIQLTATSQVTAHEAARVWVAQAFVAPHVFEHFGRGPPSAD